MAPILVMAALLAADVTPTGAASECPTSPPAAAAQRRSLAKEWFSRAEAAESAGSAALAVKAYACSLKMVPHPSSAFNMARLAEKAGDFEMALTGYRSYLKLTPEAPDRVEVQARVAELDKRAAAVRDGQAAVDSAAAAPAEPPPAESPTPPPAEPAVAGLSSAPVAEPAPAASAGARAAPWIIAATAAAALGSALALNVVARSNMTNCRSQATRNDLDTARQSCDKAKLAAYGSYGLFAVSGIALAVDIGLIWNRPSAPVQTVALSVIPGGGSLSALLRF